MSKPIRVMHVMGHMMGGGVEATVMNHYRHIDRSKVQFDFIVDSDSTVVPKTEIENLGGRVFVVPPYRQLHEYYNACENVFSEQKPDIVHSNINAMSVFPLAAAKSVGIPVRIAHSHSTANSKEHIKTLLKNMLRPLSKIMPTHLAACSESAGRWLFGDDAMDTGEIHLIKNAIEIEKFAFNNVIRMHKREELGISSRQLVIGQVGRICFQKNQMFTLSVFSRILQRIPDAILVFVGDGELMKVIRKKSHDLGLDGSIRFLGYRDDVADLYQSFDVLMFPSYYEGLPLTGVEAQASGVPIVASTQISDELDVIPSLVNRISLSETAYAWEEKIKSVAVHTIDDRKSFSKQLFNAGYSIHSSSMDLLEWYLRIVDEKGGHIEI